MRISDLADRYGVSLMTVHRDLDLLASQGWLHKVRGGATAQPAALFHGDVRNRRRTMAEAKNLIASSAISLVSPGSSIILDDSTTALALASMLPGRAPLTVVTNFLPVINRLAGEPDISLVALGGDYQTVYEAFLGLRTVRSVDSMRADMLFLSTTAIADGRCYHQSTDTIQVKQALMAVAQTRVLLADHSKFSRRALHEFAPLTAFDLVVVDDGAGPEVIDSLRSDGIKVRVASSGSAINPPAAGNTSR